MVTKLLYKNALMCAVLFLGMTVSVFAQNGVKDTDSKNDIMLQSFGWDEYQQPRVAAAGGLYEFYTCQASYLSEAGFDMVWFPPASSSTGGVGYLPTKLFNFSETSWGTEAQLKTMLTAFNDLGMYPIADIVVNHRNGTASITDFTEPVWGCEAICFNDDGGDIQGQDFDGCKPSGANDTGEDFPGSRDLDHTSSVVQEGVKEYLGILKGLGFKGWRWDVAKGFSAQYFGIYNQDSQPYYSVGEYWDGNTNTLKNWVDGTGGSSGAFDFANYYTLSGALSSGNYSSLNSGGRMPGLAGVIGYDDKAVTFIDNHDTFVKDQYIDDSNVMKGYAYILTHPGIPCVFVEHYYGGTYKKDGVPRTYADHQNEINVLMGVRKQNGINAYSAVNIVQSFGTYEAHVSPTFGSDAAVVVKLGSDLSTPSGDWIENASGSGYKVWSKKAISTPTSTCSNDISVSLIGEGISDWSTDVAMTSTDNENYTLAEYVFTGGGVKFRANNAWDLSWGGTGFPAGTAVSPSTDNIPTTAGTYAVTFNRITGAYTFTGDACVCTADVAPVCADGETYTNACEATCAGKTDYVDGACVGFDKIGIIGSATSDDADVQWETDIDMITWDGVTYYLYGQKLLTGDLKFRKNDAWTENWGAAGFPSGTGVQAGANIPVTAEHYTITFNITTGAYTFTVVPAGVSEFDFNAANVEVSVYPNPSSSDWNVSSDEIILSVKLMDASGKEIGESEEGNSSITISGKGLTSGLYFAVITTENSVQTVKLIKK